MNVRIAIDHPPAEACTLAHALTWRERLRVLLCGTLHIEVNAPAPAAPEPTPAAKPLPTVALPLGDAPRPSPWMAQPYQVAEGRVSPPTDPSRSIRWMDPEPARIDARYL